MVGWIDGCEVAFFSLFFLLLNEGMDGWMDKWMILIVGVMEYWIDCFFVRTSRCCR